LKPAEARPEEQGAEDNYWLLLRRWGWWRRRLLLWWLLRWRRQPQQKPFVNVSSRIKKTEFNAMWSAAKRLTFVASSSNSKLYASSKHRCRKKSHTAEHAMVYY
jgi:hypothetical protein